ncbi:Na+/H+ antiporter NhaA [Aquimarina sp. U1-2]|nr:Na+/H+ antiporter NhaA [Aquimarina sp. U1-2]
MVVSKLATFLKLGTLSPFTRWKKMSGIVMMAGIGFTMSLSIPELALKDEFLLQPAKIGILCGSFISACIGLLWFRYFTKKLETV